jgi:DNA-binding MarR family transcriptional regulator
MSAAARKLSDPPKEPRKQIRFIQLEDAFRRELGRLFTEREKDLYLEMRSAGLFPDDPWPTFAEICRRPGVETSPSYGSVLLARLVKVGLVNWTADPTDKRIKRFVFNDDFRAVRRTMNEMALRGEPLRPLRHRFSRFTSSAQARLPEVVNNETPAPLIVIDHKEKLVIDHKLLEAAPYRNSDSLPDPPSLPSPAPTAALCAEGGREVVHDRESEQRPPPPAPAGPLSAEEAELNTTVLLALALFGRSKGHFLPEHVARTKILALLAVATAAQIQAYMREAAADPSLFSRQTKMPFAVAFSDARDWSGWLERRKRQEARGAAMQAAKILARGIAQPRVVRTEPPTEDTSAAQRRLREVLEAAANAPRFVPRPKVRRG